MMIMNWFLDQNYGDDILHAMRETEPTIIKETDKAYFLEFKTYLGDIKGWFPKSVCILKKEER